MFSREDLERIAASWILKIKERHKLPTSVMLGIIEDVTELFQVLLENLRITVVQDLRKLGIPDQAINKISSNFCGKSTLNFSRPFQGLDTAFLQSKYFRKHFFMVVS